MNINIATPNTVSSPTPPAEREELIGDVETFLESAVLSMQQAPPPYRGPGRPPILPSLALWAGMVVCVLHGFTSQLGLWRLLRDRGVWSFPRIPVDDQAVYKRLGTEGTGPLQRLFQHITTLLTQRITVAATIALAPFAKGVYALDETTLDAVARKLPALRGRPAGDDQLLPGKLAGIFDLRRQLWVRLQFQDDPHQNEKVLARTLVLGLAVGSLILADLGYFGFAWFDWLTDQGYHWVSRLRAKTSYTVIHVFYEAGETFDGIVWLGAHRADRAAHASRLIHFRVGNTLYQYVTNVLNPTVLPPLEVARLYARRWDIELAVLLVKEHLKLHLLWSCKTAVIQQQIWAVLIIAQVLQALRLEIAWRAGVDPFEVSMALLVEYAPRYAAEGRDPVAVFVERGRELRFIRPSRRTVIRGPEIPPEALAPAPADLVVIRTPRYAERKCMPHEHSKKTKN